MNQAASNHLFGSVKITDKEFTEIRALVYENFGINLTEKKRSLVEGRLQKVIKAKGFASFRQYLDYLKADTTGQGLGEIANRISTNHTFFFREAEHFNFFNQTVLPEIADKAKTSHPRELRMWCAGCSFGDEPYSFLISMMEYFGHDYPRWDAGLLATDISLTALAGAKAGVYPAERLKLVPPLLKQKYFQKLPDGLWQVSEKLRQEVIFRRLNFMNRDFPFKKPFHIISCRNVMIYFDQTTRNDLIRKFHRALGPGGYLFIGHSETLPRDNGLFEYIKPAIYKKAT